MYLELITRALWQVELELNKIKQSEPSADMIFDLDHWEEFTHKDSTYDINIWFDSSVHKFKASLFETEPSDDNKELLTTKVDREFYLGEFSYDNKI